MIRPLLLYLLLLTWVFVGGLSAQAVQQMDLPAAERRIVEAYVQNDDAAIRALAKRIEVLVEQGQHRPGWMRAAHYGFLAEVMFGIGEHKETARYYAKGADAARADGQWTDPQTLLIRFELGNTLLILNRPDDALAVAQELVSDLKGQGSLTSEPGRKALFLLGLAQIELEDWGPAEVTGRQLLDIALRDQPQGKMVRNASSILARILTETDRFEEAVIETRRATEIAITHSGADSEEGLHARLRLGMALERAGAYAEARPVVESVLQTADRVLPPTHEIALWGRRTLEKIARAEGRKFAARALNRDLTERATESDDPLQTMDALENRAARLFADEDLDALELALRQVIVHALKYPEVPPHRAANAMVHLAQFMVDYRGDLEGAQPLLAEAISILKRELGPNNIATLQAQAEYIYAKKIEVETESAWRKTGRGPVFWDGTEEGKIPTAAELEIFRRLAAQLRHTGSQVEAVSAAMNYVGFLSGAGELDTALAVLEAERALLDEKRDTGQAIEPQISVIMTDSLGAVLMQKGRHDLAVQVFRDGVEEVLASLREMQWLAPVGGSGSFHVMGQLFSQHYATAAWKAAQGTSGRERQAYVERAFEAVQMAGYGPAAEAVARASIREKLTDPEVLALTERWHDAGFRNLSSTQRGQLDLDSLKEEISQKFPEIFEWQVPGPVALSTVQNNHLAADEAVILILPNTIEAGRVGAFNGLVIAMTQADTAIAEIPVSWDQLVFDIMRLHQSLDPGGQVMGAAQRAPMANLQNDGGAADPRQNALFEFGAAERLFRTFFGAPEIKAIAESKPVWTLVPFGKTLGVPFAALIVSDEGNRFLTRRDADGLRAVRWLGHERALNVVPSVTGLIDLRKRGLAQNSQENRLSYVGIGDPAFSGLVQSALPTMDFVMRGGPADRAAAVQSLPRLPGTRQEVETLAKLFDAPLDHVLLGHRANEMSLQELSDHGILRNADVLHFATHGLLSGAFEGLAEPALALTPLVGQNEDTSDGLLTASEAARLKIGADWVILSACDTAGEERVSGDGLGGLVQGFFSAGARNLLVSHWRVDDRAAETLITQTVKRAERGTGKAEALRQAMKELAADRSRDGTSLSNAHPSIWAPFLLIGGG